MNLSKALAQFCIAASILEASAMAQEPPKPTAEHKVLAADVGTWDATIKSYESGPDAPPKESKGTEVNEMLTGGLWLASKFEGDAFGAKFEGRGQFTYDPEKKKYIGTWIDSLGPMISLLEGTYDAKTKTMTYTGDGVEPNSKAKFTQKMVTETKDDGSRVFTLYMKFDKDFVKMLEINYKKRK